MRRVATYNVDNVEVSGYQPFLRKAPSCTAKDVYVLRLIATIYRLQYHKLKMRGSGQWTMPWNQSRTGTLNLPCFLPSLPSVGKVKENTLCVCCLISETVMQDLFSFSADQWVNIWWLSLSHVFHRKGAALKIDTCMHKGLQERGFLTPVQPQRKKVTNSICLCYSFEYSRSGSPSSCTCPCLSPCFALPSLTVLNLCG